MIFLVYPTAIFTDMALKLRFRHNLSYNASDITKGRV